MMKKNFFFLLLFFCTSQVIWGDEKLLIASFNPIATDFAKQIGGDHVEVIEIMKPGDDPHLFHPTPEDLKRTSKAKLLLFMGKGLETYLPKVKDLFSKDQKIVELGRNIPSLKIASTDELFVCCPSHSQGAIDPHWWHSIKNGMKAIRILYKSMKEVDPIHQKDYAENYQSYKKELEALYRWAKKEISQIPRKKRILSTSHAAFGYFCKEFGFKVIPIQGLTKEQNPVPSYLKEVIQTIKKERIKAAFPEKLANPKIIETLTKETGIVLGKTLIAGSPNSYTGMFKSNISSITQALGE